MGTLAEDGPAVGSYLSSFVVCNRRSERVHKLVCAAKCDLLDRCRDLKSMKPS